MRIKVTSFLQFVTNFEIPIRGHNRVFNEKVWSNNWFENLEQIDTECSRFNEESLEYFHFKYSQLIFNGKFQYLERNQDVRTDILESKKNKKVYFIRFVESYEKTEPGHIVVMNETLALPEKYTHQFVFVEWDIEKEQVNIYSEFEKVITLIQSVRFRLNL